MEQIVDRMSYERYVAMEAMAEKKHEYVAGIRRIRPEATPRHSRLAAQATACIGNALVKMEAQIDLLSSQSRVYIAATEHALYPGLSAYGEPLELSANDPHALINPALIVEIEEMGFDHLRRFHHYRHLPSFQEYLLISQKAYEVTTHFKQGEDLWEIKTIRGIDEIVPLKSIGTSVRMRDLYRRVELVGRVRSS